MTSKEKADDLIDKFLPHTQVYHEATGWEDYFDSAKECALIAVYEMIEWSMQFLNEELLAHALLYLEEVKQEIEKL